MSKIDCREINRVKRIPIGKTIELYLKICRDKLEDIVISGDFFAHPEEIIDELERELRNIELNEVNNILEKYRDKIKFAGFDYNVFKEFINEVLKEVYSNEYLSRGD
ncbi:MAG: lipoate protein ligase C-terminal domain-containing protein [Desulfurococcaceae archaeon]